MTAYRVAVTRSELEHLDILCAGIVTRDFIEDACCKPATTVLYDTESADVWPACTWHANRYGGALTLKQLREAIRVGVTHFEREDDQ